MIPKLITRPGRGAAAPQAKRKRFARTSLRTTLAGTLLLATTLGTAGAASAAGGLNEQVCRGDSHYTVCLYITDDLQAPHSHYFKVHVGIDVHMSQQDAQNILDGGGTITARMWGSDPVFDDNIQGVTRSWVSVWEGGLSAEFDRSIWGGYLDEDPEGEDEVYARVSLFDPRTGATRNFNSPEVDAFFWGGSLGP